MAVALEQEMKAKAQEARARVIEAEAEVPLAMAEAFRNAERVRWRLSKPAIRLAQTKKRLRSLDLNLFASLKSYSTW